MRRHDTKIEDGTLYVEESEGEYLEVGALEDVFQLVGGETFDIEYDTRHAAYFDWISTDADGVMTIDVREALGEMSYPTAFVEKLAALDLEDRDGPPERTAFFADAMSTAWEQKGNIDDEDNPFR
ncbi:MAG: hypothetical protein ABEJ42_01160 [Halobacteriaceae archaeon]